MSTETEPNASSKAIAIKLITNSETIERLIPERVVIKIGRQVKSPQERMLGQLGLLEQENNETAHNTKIDTAAFSNRLPELPDKAAPQTSKLQSQVEAVWFKSKVVSRSHAEIWVKDGHV
jgi:hypothetical protein